MRHCLFHTLSARAKGAAGQTWVLFVLAASLGFLAGCTARPVATLYVTGLNQPRGMAFDSAGNLFVAETGARAAGTDGKAPAANNHSGRVLRITPDRQLTTVMERLPYTYLEVNGDVGVADVVILRDQIYVLTGEGDDANLSRRILGATPGGRAKRVANFMDLVNATSADRDLDIGRIKANPYAMVAAAGGSAFYVSDGASGRILRVTLDGNISVFAELPNAPPLAGMAFGPDGRLYVTMFSLWPHTPGTGAIWAADPAGKLTAVVEDLTMPIDVAFDGVGTLYVLEFSNGEQPEQPYAPRSGRLLQLAEDGARSIVLDRLNYPTAMVFSSTEDLYIAVGGAFTAAGQGAIVKVSCLRCNVDR
jgi:sugar lactone lactonase YvrE